MSFSFMEPVFHPAQKYFSIVLSRFSRIVNQSVARMLANRARQVSRVMLRSFGGRPLQNAGIRPSRPIMRRALFALVIAGGSSPVFTMAADLVVRDHHAAQAEQAVSQQRTRQRCRLSSEWRLVVASASPDIPDQRTE
ncbi:hypothetical protein [Bradyrhizobium ivorense]|uniref:hypothetical protein n=1 Tax=Bradyrhizobium ivorense TaxID=2511166 RepID=UPI0010B704B7|nr:hypothetical protein [Bradyrhizobium ivorense]VIO67454.1 hypothetical protein CI41S_08220 [Bradyrhizobium ivorense]